MITSTISSRLPAMPASSTESSASTRSCRPLTTCAMVRSGTGPVSEMIRMGNSEKLISLIE